MPPIRRGLSLIEVVIVLALISVMMALSLPMLSNANARARAELCQQNLVEMGQSIATYAQETDALPTLHTIKPTQGGLSLPEFIEPRLHTPQVVFCPSDETEISQSLGTSYQWSGVFNGLPVDQLDSLVGQRMLGDRENFHVGPGTLMNELALEQSAAGLRMVPVGTDHSEKATTNHGLILSKKSKNPKKNKGKGHPHGHGHGHGKG
ncbi:MAG: type II secretion system GspH family protein [Phycisphaeraceae bacterium]|nr:type II secretion system GspH family protein [Phycisphaeraceae bacterium]